MGTLGDRRWWPNFERADPRGSKLLLSNSYWHTFQNAYSLTLQGIHNDFYVGKPMIVVSVSWNQDGNAPQMKETRLGSATRHLRAQTRN
jgi:hypothetical protein